MYYGSAELLALVVVYDEPCFSNTRYFWMDSQDRVWPDLKMKLKFKFLYMYCGGFYIYAIFALFFWETRCSDFMALMVHHLSTVALIVLSYIFRMSRAGSVVLALHEGSDVLLEFAKMSKNCGFQVLASIFFSLYALSWFILRLGLLPFWVMRSTSHEVLFISDKDSMNLPGNMHYYCCCLFFSNCLLFILLVLNLYWGWKILTTLSKQIRARGQVGNDMGSDPEGEDEKEHQN